MIGRPELARLAFLNGIGERAQEKDYVLAWLLAARATLGPRTLTFKGGTALRRCYFSDYRHSEDLDFTADEPLSPVELAHMLWTRGAPGSGQSPASRLAARRVSRAIRHSMSRTSGRYRLETGAP